MENITSLSQFALLLGAMAPIRPIHFDGAITNANHHKNGPFLLTDGHNGKKLIPIKTFDQCFMSPGLNAMKAYAIRIFKPPEYTCDGHDDALLICYESMMNGRQTRHGLGPAFHHRLGANPNNKVARLCNEKRDGDGKIPWHGILIRSVNINGTEWIILETALDQRAHKFSNRRQFDILLMTQWNAFTEVVPNFGSIHKGDKIKIGQDEMLLKAYEGNLTNGARMNPYKGLLMLGLDMLPHYELDNQLQLHVYRACNCSMEAWFLTPKDKHEPEMLDNLSLGHSECPAKYFERNYTFVVPPCEQIIRFKGIVASSINSSMPYVMELRFFNGNDIEMFKIDIKEMEMSLYFQTILWTQKYGNFLVPGNEFYILIGAENYNIFMYINDIFVGSFWSHEWWAAKDKCLISKQVKKMEVKGDILLLHEPQITEADKKLSHLLPAVPYIKPVDCIVPIERSFRIYANAPENAKKFSVRFMHDAMEWHKYIGATVMQINVDYRGKIWLQSYFNGQESSLILYDNGTINDTVKDGPTKPCTGALCKINEHHLPIVHGNGKIGSQMDIPTGKFELDIIARYSNNSKTDYFEFKINSNEIHDAFINIYLPLSSINWLRIDGDIELLVKPEIMCSYNHNAEARKLHTKLKTVLHEGDLIKITGSATSFKDIYAYFMHESYEPDYSIGDIPLRFKIELSGGKIDFKTAWYENKINKYIQVSNKTLDPLDFSADFNLEISINATHYVVTRLGNFHNVTLTEFPHRHPLTKKNSHPAEVTDSTVVTDASGVTSPTEVPDPSGVTSPTEVPDPSGVTSSTEVPHPSLEDQNDAFGEANDDDADQTEDADQINNGRDLVQISAQNPIDSDDGTPSTDANDTCNITREDGNNVAESDEIYFPPWAVDHIYIRGALNAKIIVIPAKANNQIKQVDKLMKNGDHVKIGGKIKAANFSVYFFSEGLAPHPFIGKTIFALQINNLKEVCMRSVYGGKELNKICENETNGLKLELGESVEFNIEVSKESFVIHANNAEFSYKPEINKCIYKYAIPIWAIQYIVVDDGFEVHNEIELEQRRSRRIFGN